jgi:hypothetical protein
VLKAQIEDKAMTYDTDVRAPEPEPTEPAAEDPEVEPDADQVEEAPVMPEEDESLDGTHPV